MPVGRVELPLPEGKRILSPSRLPVPPHRLSKTKYRILNHNASLQPSNHFEKIIQRTVITPFIILACEKACRNFTVFPVIMKALAALVFLAARFIAAVAILFIVLKCAFHSANI